jgi:DNA-binding MarR family transcriptional regulator
MSSECICIVLRTAARKVTALYDDALAPHGVTIAQYSLLRRVGRAGRVSLTELGRLAELDRSTIGRNVRVLDQAGFVRVESGDDQREAQVRLTEAGLATIDACREPWERAQKAVEAKIGAEGLAALRALAGSV